VDVLEHNAMAASGDARERLVQEIETICKDELGDEDLADAMVKRIRG
jgi:hypothetical protein